MKTILSQKDYKFAFHDKLFHLENFFKALEEINFLKTEAQ